MRRQLNILAVCTFMLGMIVMPAVHMAALAADHDQSCCSHDCGHGRSEPQKHDADHCSICQLAQMPFAATGPDIAPVAAAPTVVERMLPPMSAPVLRVDHALPFACGPPA